MHLCSKRLYIFTIARYGLLTLLISCADNYSAFPSPCVCVRCLYILSACPVKVYLCITPSLFCWMLLLLDLTYLFPCISHICHRQRVVCITVYDNALPTTTFWYLGTTLWFLGSWGAIFVLDGNDLMSAHCLWRTCQISASALLNKCN